jgi:hypothetical protein
MNIEVHFVEAKSQFLVVLAKPNPIMRRTWVGPRLDLAKNRLDLAKNLLDLAKNQFGPGQESVGPCQESVGPG